MSFLSALIISGFLLVCVLAAIWIGVYVVLPLFLIGLIVSAVVSIVRFFLPNPSQKTTHNRVFEHQKSEKNQIIDVEFEEVK
ncbi:MAG: hypothetical protein II942_00400 [Alphaproteobacteria bacterium]|nr:hypothetical protein [Alphaproteobacteria bacterium]